MTKETADCIDISAILNTYVYMDEQNSKYQNKTLSNILDNMPDDVKKTSDYKAVYDAIKENPQLGEMKLVSQSMCDGTDKNGDLVIACTFQDTNGDIYVAYRGTGDGKWVDNGVGIANESSEMQRAANEYFDQVVEDLGLTTYDFGRLIVTGHSKGGNEAQYVTLNSEYGYLVDRCYSIDGQGFSKEAIDHFIDEHGKAYYEKQLQKMYSINGENDYVHDLGIVVIPEENTYFVETPGANDIGGYHDIKEMLSGAELNWSRDENGNIISADQGPIGQLAKAISGKMQQLNQEDLEDCAVTVMSLIEYLMPYKNENGESVLGGVYQVGTGDVKFMTVEEFFGFLAHGIPMVIDTLLTTDAGQAMLSELMKSGLGAVYNEAGVFGIVGVLFVSALLLPLATGLVGELVLLGQLVDIACDFVDAIKDLAGNIKKWVSDLKETIKNTINKIKAKIRSWSAGGRYATEHPRIEVDTFKLRNYASRIYDVNRRISNLDGRMDSLYWRVGLLDLWNLMQADLMTGYSWRLLRAASYLNDIASNFDAIETELANGL